MQYCAVYINQGLNAHREAFSPAIIIEELLLQRFLHTLSFCPFSLRSTGQKATLFRLLGSSPPPPAQHRNVWAKHHVLLEYLIWGSPAANAALLSDGTNQV